MRNILRKQWKASRPDLELRSKVSSAQPRADWAYRAAAVAAALLLLATAGAL